MNPPLRFRLMNYELEFKNSALKEWQKLDESLQTQFKSPHISKSRLSGGVNLYKIKLKKSGYRLVYQKNQPQDLVLQGGDVAA